MYFNKDINGIVLSINKEDNVIKIAGKTLEWLLSIRPCEDCRSFNYDKPTLMNMLNNTLTQGSSDSMFRIGFIDSVTLDDLTFTENNNTKIATNNKLFIDVCKEYANRCNGHFYFETYFTDLSVYPRFKFKFEPLGKTEASSIAFMSKSPIVSNYNHLISVQNTMDAFLEKIPFKLNGEVLYNNTYTIFDHVRTGIEFHVGTTNITNEDVKDGYNGLFEYQNTLNDKYKNNDDYITFDVDLKGTVFEDLEEVIKVGYSYVLIDNDDKRKMNVKCRSINYTLQNNDFIPKYSFSTQ
jgi:hypothetical protein